MAARDWPLEDYELQEGLLARVQSPALCVHLDLVEHNVRCVIEHLGGDVSRWRPHTKTTKLPEVFDILLDHGVRAFKCATTREARVLLERFDARGEQGIELLVAYPLLGPALTRLGHLAKAHPSSKLSVLIEDEALVPELPEGLFAHIDVNPGMNRSGVPMHATKRILSLARALGGRFEGLHFYEGQIQEADPARRFAKTRPLYDRLLELHGSLHSAGIPTQELVTSGTPAFLAALAYKPLGGIPACKHRVSPGTVVFHDARSSEEIPELPLRPAAVLCTRVVSHPTADVVTCDAGSKSIAAEAGDPCAVVLGHAGLHPMKPSEEHLPLRVEGGESPKRGTVLYLVPRHVCPTTNLAEEVLLLRGAKLVGKARIAARAHDLFLDEE